MCTSSSFGKSFLILTDGRLAASSHDQLSRARWICVDGCGTPVEKSELRVGAGLFRFFQQGFDGPHLSFDKVVSLGQSR